MSSQPWAKKTTKPGTNVKLLAQQFTQPSHEHKQPAVIRTKQQKYNQLPDHISQKNVPQVKSVIQTFGSSTTQQQEDDHDQVKPTASIKPILKKQGQVFVEYEREPPASDEHKSAATFLSRLSSIPEVEYRPASEGMYIRDDSGVFEDDYYTDDVVLYGQCYNRHSDCTSTRQQAATDMSRLSVDSGVTESGYRHSLDNPGTPSQRHSGPQTQHGIHEDNWYPLPQSGYYTDTSTAQQRQRYYVDKSNPHVAQTQHGQYEDNWAPRRQYQSCVPQTPLWQYVGNPGLQNIHHVPQTHDESDFQASLRRHVDNINPQTTDSYYYIDNQGPQTSHSQYVDNSVSRPPLYVNNSGPRAPQYIHNPYPRAPQYVNNSGPRTHLYVDNTGPRAQQYVNNCDPRAPQYIYNSDPRAPQYNNSDPQAPQYNNNSDPRAPQYVKYSDPRAPQSFGNPVSQAPQSLGNPVSREPQSLGNPVSRAPPSLRNTVSQSPQYVHSPQTEHENYYKNVDTYTPKAPYNSQYFGPQYVDNFDPRTTQYVDNTGPHIAHNELVDNTGPHTAHDELVDNTGPHTAHDEAADCWTDDFDSDYSDETEPLVTLVTDVSNSFTQARDIISRQLILYQAGSSDMKINEEQSGEPKPLCSPFSTYDGINTDPGAVGVAANNKKKLKRGFSIGKKFSRSESSNKDKPGAKEFISGITNIMFKSSLEMTTHVQQQLHRQSTGDAEKTRTKSVSTPVTPPEPPPKPVVQASSNKESEVEVAAKRVNIGPRGKPNLLPTQLYQQYTALAYIQELQVVLNIDEDPDTEDYYELVNQKRTNLDKTNEVRPRINNTFEHNKLWCHLAEVVNSELLLVLTRQQKKLQEAKFEIITSEASYVRSLNVLEIHFINQLEQKNTTDRDKLQRLFNNVLNVKKCADKLLSELERCWEQDILLPNICDVVYEAFVNDYTWYVKFCRNQVHMEQTLAELMDKNIQFNSIVKDLESDPIAQKQTLRSFLMLPIQRITRVPLLVGAVLARLDTTDDEYTMCRNTFDLLNKIVKECDDELTKMQRCEDMLRLSQQLEFPSHIKSIPIITKSRYIMKQGCVQQLVTREESKLRFKKSVKIALNLFLFPDLLLIAKKKSGNNYTVVDHCSRNLLHAWSQQDVNTAGDNVDGKFQLMLTLLENHEGKELSMVLLFNGESDRQRWAEVLTPNTTSDNPEECIYEEWDCPMYRVIDEFCATQTDELSLCIGDKVNILRKTSDGLAYGERIRDGAKGWFPLSYTFEIKSEHQRAKNKKQRYQVLNLSRKFIDSQMKIIN